MRIHVDHDRPARRPPIAAVLAEFRPHRRVAGLAVFGVLLMTVCVVLMPLVVEVVVDREIGRAHV